MRCPRLLGLVTRARVIFASSPNQLSIQLPDHSEIDLILIDCFPPPMLLRVEHRRVGSDELFYKERPNPAGQAAYAATIAAIKAMPTWTRVFVPTPRHDREWFRNLAPGTKQPGHLWIAEHQTLSEHLVSLGHATTVQPDCSSPHFDGNRFVTSQEDQNLWSFSPN